MRVFLAVLIILFIEPSQSWARRRRTDKKRSLAVRSLNSIVKETCNTEVNACGFTIQCTCCSDPSFKSCAGTNLIGSPLLTSLVKRDAEEKRAAPDAAEADEAGCHLRSVVYNGQELCIPGNVAAMISIVSTSTDNECYPVYPMGCLNALSDDTPYYQHFYIGVNAVETLASLKAHGHKCKNQDTKGADAGEIQCLI